MPARCWPTRTPPVEGQGLRPGVKDTFTVGFMPGLIVTAEVRALSSRHPELTVDVVRTYWDDQIEVIHDGRVDVSYIRQPVDPRGLEIRSLLSEPRVVVATRRTPLGGQAADQHHRPCRGASPAGSRRRARVARHRHRTPRDRSPPGRSVLSLGGGEARARCGGARRDRAPVVHRHLLHAGDVTHVGIEDIAPNHVCLAWDSSRRSPLIGEFVSIATSELLDRPGGDIPV